MKNQNIKKLEGKKDHLELWLDRHNKAQDVVPYVQKNLELTKWQIDALTHLPDEAAEIPLNEVSEQIDRDVKIINVFLPMMPDYDYHLLNNSTGTTTSSSASVYEVVSRLSDFEKQSSDLTV